MILLWACAASEAERLLGAHEAPSFDAARATCEELRGQRRDNCLLAAMRDFDRRERTDCALISEEVARGECLFAYAERVALDDPAEAMSACAATPFSRECSYHLLRVSARTVEERPVAEAAAAIEPWRAVSAVKDPDRLFWKAYFRERAARNMVIDPTGCPGEPCERGAREQIVGLLNARKSGNPALCAGPVPADPRWADTEQVRGWVSAWSRNECAPPHVSPPG